MLRSVRARFPLAVPARPVCAAVLGALVLAAPLPAMARPGGWGGEGWGVEGRGVEGWGRDTWGREPWGHDSRSGWDGGMIRGAPRDRARNGPPEDRVTVATFTTEETAAAATLRTGTISVTGAPTGSGVDSGELAVFAAAVVDQLGQAGYRTDVTDSAAGQVTELHISHETLQPEEIRKPVSGEMAVGVSNRGTAYGMALNIDLSKPKTALISTTLEARIRDKASGQVLWEGRADIATRQGDDKWSSGAIATRLAAALFDRFPDRSGPPT